MTVLEMLMAIRDNPEDLTELPNVIEQVTTMQGELDTATEKIGTLHGLNRKYLSMIPVTDNTVPQEQEEKKVTVEDAVSEIMKGVI